MPYNGGSITDSEFFKAACRWKNSSDVKTAVAWWSAFCEVIYSFMIKQLIPLKILTEELFPMKFLRDFIRSLSRKMIL